NLHPFPTRRSSDLRILYFAAADGEEIAPGAWPDRHLRQDREILETSERQALKAGRASAQRGIKEKLGPTQAIVQRSSRADSPQVRARQRGPNTGDFREATLRRTRAPRHTKAVGHCQESREKRVGE